MIMIMMNMAMPTIMKIPGTTYPQPKVLQEYETVGKGRQGHHSGEGSDLVDRSLVLVIWYLVSVAVTSWAVQTNLPSLCPEKSEDIWKLRLYSTTRQPVLKPSRKKKWKFDQNYSSWYSPCLNILGACNLQVWQSPNFPEVAVAQTLIKVAQLKFSNFQILFVLHTISKFCRTLKVYKGKGNHDPRATRLPAIVYI